MGRFTTPMTPAAIHTYFRRINDAGNGYGAGDEIDDPTAAAEREGWTVLHAAESSDDLTVAYDAAADRFVLIGDVNGAWAADVEAALGLAGWRAGAGEAGDAEMVALIDRALSGDLGALKDVWSSTCDTIGARD